MKNKKIFFAFCAIGLGVIIIIFSLGIPSRTPQNGNVIVTMKSDAWKIVQKRGGIEMDMKGFRNYGGPGLPVLPSKIYRFMLPPNTVLISVQKVKKNQRVRKIEKEWNLGKPVASNDTSKTKKTYINKFDPHKSYPASNFEILEQSQNGPYQYVTIRYWPVQLIGAKKQVVITTDLTLRLKYKTNAQAKRGFGSVKKWLSEKGATSFFNNYYDIKDLYKDNVLNLDATVKYFMGSKYDYVIVTTNAIYSAAKTVVDKFKKHKESLGFSVIIVTENFYGNCPGTDATEKVRAFLKNKYEEWGIEYVLIIGGDIDIPMKRVMGAEEVVGEGFYDDGTPMQIKQWVDQPTDWCFADLDGEWDKDGNGNPGQITDLGIDGVDFNAEVVVGRIPVYHASVRRAKNPIYNELNVVLNRIKGYENSANYEWRNSILLIGAILDYGSGKHDDDLTAVGTDGAQLMESINKNILELNNLVSYKLYEEGDDTINSPQSPLYEKADGPVTQENVVNEIGAGYGLIVWEAHGSPNVAFRRLMNSETVLTEDKKFIEINDSANISDTYPPIIWSGSCLNSYPEGCNLMHALLRNVCVATIGATRESWYTFLWKNLNDGSSQTQTFLFTQYLLMPWTVMKIENIYNNDISLQYEETHHYFARIGDAFNKMKKEYYENYSTIDVQEENALDLKNNYVFTLYGDPAMRMRKGLVEYEFFTDDLIQDIDMTDIFKKAQSFNLIDCIGNYISYKNLYVFLRNSNRKIPTLMIDIDNDGLKEWIIFVDALRSGKAVVFDSIKEGGKYLGCMRFAKSLVNQYIVQLNRK